MKKVFLLLALVLFLSGCATTAQHITKKGLYDAMVEKPVSQSRIYDYSYDKVYTAIVATLEKRLNYGVGRLYTSNDTIYSNYLEAPSRGQFCGYAYLFIVKKIDDTHTEVNLRASGGLCSVSDKDMLDKYVKEELEYRERTKELK